MDVAKNMQPRFGPVHRVKQLGVALMLLRSRPSVEDAEGRPMSNENVDVLRHVRRLPLAVFRLGHPEGSVPRDVDGWNLEPGVKLVSIGDYDYSDSSTLVPCPRKFDAPR